jgi:hypothetical protein
MFTQSLLERRIASRSNWSSKMKRLPEPQEHYLMVRIFYLDSDLFSAGKIKPTLMRLRQVTDSCGTR